MGDVSGLGRAKARQEHGSGASLTRLRRAHRANLLSLLLLSIAACSSRSVEQSDAGSDEVDAAGETAGTASSGGSTTASGGGDSTAASGGEVATGGTQGSTSGTGGSAVSGTGGDTDAGLGGDGTVVGVLPGDWVVPDALLLCNGGPCQCANGIDDDGDGQADGFDVECIGPNDDDEGSFATGIAGDNKDPKWQDCFFDGDSGAGNDGCAYHMDCLRGLKTSDDPDCTVSEECTTYCAQRTPSGCDCFGCCDLKAADGSVHSVFISPECDAEQPDSCESCVKSEQCENPCSTCEVCSGKSLADLPAECFGAPGGEAATTGGAAGGASGGATGGSAGDPGGDELDTEAPFICDSGALACLSSQDCTYGDYCSFGCCITALQ